MLFSFLQDSVAALYGISSIIHPRVNQQPLASTSIHGPENRGYWKDGFDINTDYEVKIPEGKLVEVGTFRLGVINRLMVPCTVLLDYFRG